MKDAEKYLEAALGGWRVIRLTERQLDAEWIERVRDYCVRSGRDLP